MGHTGLSEEDLTLLTSAFNDQGSILEHQAYRILSEKFSNKHLDRNLVIPFDEVRYEIDLLLRDGHCHFVIECKQSMRYGWFFYKEKKAGQNFHLIWDSSRSPARLETRSISLPDCKQHYGWNLDIAEGVAEFTLDPCGGLLKQEVTKPIKGKRLVPSSRDEYMRDKVRQVLYNTQYHIYEEQEWHSLSPKRDKTLKNKFVPLLVTNAPLYLIEYDENSIDSNGDLSSIEKEQRMDWIGLNFCEALHWGPSLKQRIEGEDGTHLKTVFCVHISKLAAFIEMFCGRR